MLNRFERIRILDQQRHLRETLMSLTSPRSSDQANRFDLLFRLLVQFELLAKSLYRLRATEQNDPLRHSTEELVANASRDLLGLQAAKRERSPDETWIYRYRWTWRENFSLFLYTLAMFVVACVVGWNVGVADYEYASLLIPQHLMEQILDQQKWFEYIQRAPFLYGFGIARNNIAGLAGFISWCLMGYFLVQF